MWRRSFLIFLYFIYFYTHHLLIHSIVADTMFPIPEPCLVLVPWNFCPCNTDDISNPVSEPVAGLARSQQFYMCIFCVPSYRAFDQPILRAMVWEFCFLPPLIWWLFFFFWQSLALILYPTWELCRDKSIPLQLNSTQPLPASRSQDSTFSFHPITTVHLFSVSGSLKIPTLFLPVSYLREKPSTRYW